MWESYFFSGHIIVCVDCTYMSVRIGKCSFIVAIIVVLTLPVCLFVLFYVQNEIELLKAENDRLKSSGNTTPAATPAKTARPPSETSSTSSSSSRQSLGLSLNNLNITDTIMSGQALLLNLHVKLFGPNNVYLQHVPKSNQNVALAVVTMFWGIEKSLWIFFRG